ncbi:ABC transporter permease subunit [Mesorhizobium sp.]|uniref:ABC transporter permease subunit n=1 Tax=Mesorhizobium sp. TaxID=1871066 RepID=UPI0025FE9046|nr:ABC transporter permease subunit [Mesorhizobium sp.]
MLGLHAGWRRRGPVDHIATGASLALYSGFWLGMILVVIFSTALGWLPGYGALSPGAITGSLDWLLDYLRHLALPVTAGALGLIGQYVVVARAAMSDIVTEDYMVPHGPKG